jgi:hypothetical protein
MPQTTPSGRPSALPAYLVFAGALLLGSLIAVYFFVLFQLNARLVEALAQAQTHYPQLLSDLKNLKGHPPFPASPRTRNAEGLILSRVGFVGEPGEPQLLALFAKHPDWNKSFAAFQAFAADPEIQRIDARWIRELQPYDFLDANDDPKIRPYWDAVPQASSLDRIALMAARPSPNYGALAKSAAVFLAQEVKAGRTKEGLQAFHKVTELLHSAHGLRTTLLAADQLDLERKLAAGFRLKGWPSVPASLVEAYRQVGWGMMSVYEFQWEKPMPQGFYAFLDPRLGVCAGASPTELHGVLAYQDFFAPRWPLEPNFGPALRQEKKLLQRLVQVCGRPEWSAFLERAEHPGPPKILQHPASRSLREWPFLRRWFGLQLLSASTVNTLRY